MYQDVERQLRLSGRNRRASKHPRFAATLPTLRGPAHAANPQRGRYSRVFYAIFPFASCFRLKVSCSRKLSDSCQADFHPQRASVGVKACLETRSAASSMSGPPFYRYFKENCRPRRSFYVGTEGPLPSILDSRTSRQSHAHFTSNAETKLFARPAERAACVCVCVLFSH